ncbi:MAG: hypothetical protein M1371_04460 [Actinobacteria bacterium]|nr:hypothetical protein [Actinomycetota bacterium]
MSAETVTKVKTGSSSENKKIVVRFSIFQRFIHFLMMVSFIGLVTTGMPLKFRNAFWAQPVANIFGGIRNAGRFHRAFAILMFVYVAFYICFLIYWIISRRGRITGPDSLFPRRKDVYDFVGNIRYFLGKGPKPSFDRWTYWEKFDFWGEVWGFFVIGLTGLFLWFPEFFSRIFPGWVFNVAVIIHGYEALLASLFIFFVHFFNAHMRPEKFPIDPVMITGELTLEELKAERPFQYQRLVEEGKLDDLLIQYQRLDRTQ